MSKGVRQAGGMLKESYPTDWTDAQWRRFKPMLPKPSPRGRPPAEARTMMEGIFYVLHGGIQWRRRPRRFGPGSTVPGTYRRWRRQGLWAQLHARRRTQVRAQHGKCSRPTACILDRQTVRSADRGGAVGDAAAKKTQGRKRPVLVDPLGLILGVFITPASTPERLGAPGLLARVLGGLTWWRKRWADGGDSGPEFAQWVRQPRRQLEVEVVQRSDDVKGFAVRPRRWVVERTFGWLRKQRRLVRDDETLETSAEAGVDLAMSRIQLRRLA